MERLAPTPEAKAKSAKSVPLGRMGTVDDVADVCLFLASDYARYVSGVVLPADGGWTAGRTLGGMG
jgi:NAD(P)-dependent dehydrogenase (short-subunit alcohol dehydrogenase family)